MITRIAQSLGYVTLAERQAAQRAASKARTDNPFLKNNLTCTVVRDFGTRTFEVWA